MIRFPRGRERSLSAQGKRGKAPHAPPVFTGLFDEDRSGLRFSPILPAKGGDETENGAERVRVLSERAAAAAIRRVTRMLNDGDTPSGDALKAAALVFEKIYRPAAESADAPFDIRVE